MLDLDGVEFVRLLSQLNLLLGKIQSFDLDRMAFLSREKKKINVAEICRQRSA